MAKTNKFGTFAGVFTPSLLTILGVIMYMRLGWVVGQAGLIAAVGIILVAHIISVTTGLSIASIATDKKIKGGGIYYMLSRTLGLPMGGAIGIALFLGTALSISLYIIGFAESFLSIPFVARFLNLQPGVEGYRIVGTAVIIILVILAFISTSLAIKAQFLILGAILLSLVSIFAGYFIHPELAPAEPLLGIAEGDVSLEMVFAIFFPAVTGFTAGVAMSGDLKDPKKSIPLGTILAIAVGFLVYMLLAISLAFFVKRDYLINDTNILQKVSWIPALLFAGIWGATLSSALGGILGGPRILQALSKDKVMPGIFRKGYGASNEPRNALIFIFLIAEGGILIGELNLIAGIVTMFYLASYGFINLAYILESWASTDFRPSFKVSRIFGVAGFLFAFGIMFKLDFVSMLASLVIMGCIYFILKKKHLNLDFGDVWQSVWNSVVRRGLHRLSSRTIEERNWQPNIILFSGGSEFRPYLIEFGKSLVGKFGFLSNFDLIEAPSAKVLFPKLKQQQLVRDEDTQGIFTRRQTCKDIYEGIETIARTYGFSGIEPNTIILGWARQTKNPKRFQQLLTIMDELDYNILLIDYDKRYGYGKYQQIDIWWQGEGNDGNLALTLAKLMITSIYWEKARIRLLVVNFENDKDSYIHHRADEILASMRLDAEVKVINNQIEHKAIYDIIRTESRSADIVFVEIPEIKETDEDDYVEKTNILLREIGTVVLIKASSGFTELSLGVSKDQKSVSGLTSAETSAPEEIDFNPSPHNQLNDLLRELSLKILNNYKTTYQVFILVQQDSFSNFLNELREKLIENFDTLDLNINHLSDERISRFVANNLQGFFNLLNTRLSEFKSGQTEQLKTLLDTVIKEYDLGQKNIMDQVPDQLILYFSSGEFKVLKGDLPGFILFKKFKRFLKKKQDHLQVPFAFKAYYYDLHTAVYKNFIETFEQTVKTTFFFLKELQKLLKRISSEYYSFRKLSSEKDLSSINISETRQTFLRKVDELDLLLKNLPIKLSAYYSNALTREINASVRIADTLKTVYYFSGQKDNTSKIKVIQSKLNESAESYFSNLTLLLNANEAENWLLQFDNVVNYELNEIIRNTNNFISNEITDKLNILIGSLNEMVESGKQKETGIENLFPSNDMLRKKISTLNTATVRKISRILPLLPTEMTLMDEISFNDFSENKLDDIKAVKIYFSQMVESLIENKISVQLNQYGIALRQFIDEQLIKTKEYYLSYLLTFNEFSNKDNEEIYSLNNFLLNQINKISNSRDEILRSFEKYYSQVSGLKSEISGHLTLYGITKQGGQLKHYIHSQAEQENISWLKKRSRDFINRYSEQAVRFKYGKTQAISYARIMQKDGNTPGMSNQFLEISKKIKPSPDILKQIPFYYKQLFPIRQAFHKDFWVPLTKETEQSEIIFSQSRNLNEGVLLITGDHHSGKSFLSYILAHRWNRSGRVVFLNPPSGGSTDLKIFEDIITETFQQENYSDSIFELLPQDSILIFDDIELWWQRTEDGLIILDNILRIISLYRNRFFFILNVNTYAYKLIDKLLPLSSYLLGVIKLNPMSVKSMKEMITLRHHGAGLDLIYKNKREYELSVTKLADLYIKIYKFSNGNPGVALSTWISSINKVDKNSLTIEPIEMPHIDFINKFQPNTILLIIQLLVHRQITLKRLISVLEIEPQVVERELQFLYRMGIVNRLHIDVYEINIYWYPVLSQYLVNKNYI